MMIDSIKLQIEALRAQVGIDLHTFLLIASI